uniref:GT-D fold-like domain-containing protein n=1 Tax=viral metagenome TaxID=1070528 RepID=A0A6C0E1S4_9ZZZZ
MKIVRLGMTEMSLLFLTFICNNYNLDDASKTHISNIILSLVNWLYTTSGYYDKSVKGNHFNFDITALNSNYYNFINHLEQSVGNCNITQAFVHEGYIMNLLNTYKNDFMKKYNITTFNILNGTEFQDRLDDIFSMMHNKKVLIISSFDGLVKQQYESGNLNKIYVNFPNLIKLETIKFPYCFHNNGPHNNYFETLDTVFQEIKQIDFDIAILGCGAYGHMLCHKIDTELNKDAIYVGGSIQTLFGIASSREKQHGKIQINEYWISDIPAEYRPVNYQLIENGCYW